MNRTEIKHHKEANVRRVEINGTAQLKEKREQTKEHS